MSPRLSQIELLVVEGYCFLCQIENEYGNLELAYGPAGKSYISWAASMATSLDTGVPWVMCRQNDAPDPIVSFLIDLAWQFSDLVRNLSWAQHRCYKRSDQVTSNNLLLITWLCIIFSISFAFRSTLAMDFTVINSTLILTRSQKCGLRVIVDGKLSLVVPNNLAVRMGCWMLFPWIEFMVYIDIQPHDFVFLAWNKLSSFTLYFFDLHDILGFSRTEILCRTDLWKTLHLLWLAFSSLVELSKIIIWYCNYIGSLCLHSFSEYFLILG